MNAKTKAPKLSKTDQAALEAEAAFYNMAAISHALNSGGQFRVTDISEDAAARINVILFLTQQMLVEEFRESIKTIQ